MGDRREWTKWIWLAAATVLIVSAAALRGPITQAVESDYQAKLSAEIARENPEYMLLTTAPGVLRAPLVGYLWMSADEMKDEGRVFDLYQRSNLICQLQPRFAGTWAFHAWNMSYNIVAQCDTEEERWQWIRNGIGTLRDKGLDYNPRALALHKELAWIFFHKIGGFSDNSHWYYKRRLASEMQHLLAAPAYGSTEEAIAAFRPIAEAPLDRQRPSAPPASVPWLPLSVATVLGIGALVLLAMPRMHSIGGLVLVVVLLAAAGGVFSVSVYLARPDTDALSADYRTAEQRLLEDPDAAAFVRQARALGLDLDQGLLAAFNRYSDSPDLRAVRVLPPEEPDESSRAVAELMTDPAQAEARQKVLAFVRAKLLWHGYRMDPAEMLALMERFGPLDWRLPWSHSLYWSLRGLAQTEGTNIDDVSYGPTLQTARVVLNSLKNLTWNGRLMYTENPRNPDLPMLSLHLDPRYVPAMLKTYDQFRKRSDEDFGPEDNTFMSGHINYLAGVMNALYAMGEREMAQEIFDYMKRVYDPPGAEWDYPLREFVLYRINREGRPIRKHAIAQVTAALRAGLLLRLGRNAAEAADSFDYARNVYEIYQSKAKGAYPLPPLERMIASEAMALVVNPKIVGVDHLSLTDRSRIYNDSQLDDNVRRLMYDAVKAALAERCQREGIDFDRAFPEPPGMDAFRQQYQSQYR